MRRIRRCALAVSAVALLAAPTAIPSNARQDSEPFPHVHGAVAQTLAPQLFNSPGHVHCGTGGLAYPVHTLPTVLGFTGYHCPTIPASTVGTVAGYELQERDARVLRLVVDMDGDFAGYYRARNAQPSAAALLWLQPVADVFWKDARIRLEIAAMHEHALGENLTATDAGGLLSQLWDYWRDDPIPRDDILLLTGKNLGFIAGAARMGTAGHSDLPHVAVVVDLSHSILGGQNPYTWMITAILHELGHTLSLTHEMGTCGVHEAFDPSEIPPVGCSVMIGPYLETATGLVGWDDDYRVSQYGEVEEFFLRGHAESHLAALNHVPGLVDPPPVGVPDVVPAGTLEDLLKDIEELIHQPWP